MNLFDPNRRRTNDKPELLGRRVVVPRLYVFPHEQSPELTQIAAMVPDDRGGKFTSRQVLRTLPSVKLAEVLDAYRIDPEATLETLFSINLAPIAEPSDIEFARDLKRGASVQTPRSNTIETVEP